MSQTLCLVSIDLIWFDLVLLVSDFLNLQGTRSLRLTCKRRLFVGELNVNTKVNTSMKLIFDVDVSELVWGDDCQEGARKYKEKTGKPHWAIYADSRIWKRKSDLFLHLLCSFQRTKSVLTPKSSEVDFFGQDFVGNLHQLRVINFCEVNWQSLKYFQQKKIGKFGFSILMLHSTAVSFANCYKDFTHYKDNGKDQDPDHYSVWIFSHSAFQAKIWLYHLWWDEIFDVESVLYSYE